jgi:penicillin-binding protein 1A
MRAVSIGISAFLLLAIAGFAVAFLAVQHYADGLPDYRALMDYQPKVVTRVYAGDGGLLAEFATEKRIFVPVASIPQRVKNAFIAAEDKNFYRHGGVDPEGILRAAVVDLRNLRSGRRPVGGSTITQQVARNFLLTQDVSVSRKIKEMILAYRIEQVLSKDQILELYLNEIYLGLNSYGVAAAALDYFDKPMDQLTVAEAAFLAALPKAPDRYYREKNHEVALDRRNYVIGRMLTDGSITEAQAKAAIAQPLIIHRAKEPEIVPAGYFAEEVRRELLQTYGADRLYGGGLTVRTTLDPELQAIAVRSLRDGLVNYDERHGWRGPVAHLPALSRWAEQLGQIPVPDGAGDWNLGAVLEIKDNRAKVGLADGTIAQLSSADMRWTERTKVSDILQPSDVVLVEKTVAPSPSGVGGTIGNGKRGDVSRPAADLDIHVALRQVPAVNGAVVAIDPHTGRVLALAGGLSDSSNAFDRATQAYRQPGSASKPFVYMAALDSGYTPSTIVLDSPIVFDQGPGLPQWRPNNYEHEFLGPLPLSRGLELSRNAMTVRLAAAIGMPKMAAYARKFGIIDDMPLDLSMALGAGETTLMRLVTGYAEIDNGGKKLEATLIDRVQDRRGRTLFRHDTRPCDACARVDWTDQAVPQIPDTRQQIQDPRTDFQMIEMLEGVVQRGTGRGLASLGRPLGGKTGTTNDSKDLWFVGFSPNLVVGAFVGFDEPKSLGAYETGATVALPIIKAFLATALAEKPPVPFHTPPELRLAKVDSRTGEPAASDDPGAIWEAFLPGTEPGVDHPKPPGSAVLTATDADGTRSLQAATTGMGGIY